MQFLGWEIHDTTLIDYRPPIPSLPRPNATAKGRDVTCPTCVVSGNSRDLAFFVEA